MLDEHRHVTDELPLALPEHPRVKPDIPLMWSEVATYLGEVGRMSHEGRHFLSERPTLIDDLPRE